MGHTATAAEQRTAITHNRLGQKGSLCPVDTAVGVSVGRMQLCELEFGDEERAI